MKRLSAVLAALVVGIAAALPVTEATALERRPMRGQLERRHIGPRVRPNLHRDFPIKRPPREVIIRRPQVRVRITPRVFLPPVIFFGGVVVDDRRYDRPYYYDSRRYYDERYRTRYYDRDRLTWFDSEYLYADDGWSEFTLECNAYGRKLWFDVRDGRIRIDWAEIVFDNGEVQVVDFSERTLGPGIYPLFDFRGGRRVDHVRMVAEASTREAQVILRLEQ